MIETHDVTDDYGNRLYSVTTVQGEPMPNLRSPGARTQDAARRGLDCRTADDKLVAELVRMMDCLQALTLRLEVVEGVVTHIARAINLQEVRP